MATDFRRSDSPARNSQSRTAGSDLCGDLPSGVSGPIRIVGTHLDHTVDDANRIAQVRALNRRFGTHDMPTLLVGDLNAEPGSAPIELLLEAAWRCADPSFAPTYPAEDANLKIDWMFLSSGNSTFVKDATVLSEPVASDHRPFRATWVLRGIEE